MMSNGSSGPIATAVGPAVSRSSQDCTNAAVASVEKRTIRSASQISAVLPGWRRTCIRSRSSKTPKGRRT